jgi:CRISPR-associated protein Csx10
MNEYQTFPIVVEAHSPLVLGDESMLGNFGQTLAFIPGAVIRGAVAARALGACTSPPHRRDHAQCPDHDHCPFWQLFGADQVLFGPAYPGVSGPVYPFPLTARTCKYHPGLPKPDRLLEEGHGVFDILAERLVYELLTDPEFPERVRLVPAAGSQRLALKRALAEKCPKCGAPVEPAQGYYTPAAGQNLIPGAEVFIRRTAHVGINRARFVAEDSLLFTQEAAETRGTPVKFYGQVTAPAALAALLQPYLVGEHFLGHGRSRDYGRSEIGITTQKAPADLPTRVQELHMALRGVLARWRGEGAQLPAELPGTFFSLTLHSPAILEDLGRPHLVPTAEELGLPEAKLLRAWTKPAVIGGWDVAAGLPRRTRLAACAGSVYLYCLPPGAAYQAPLEALERQGLGAERSRGLGQVAICAPFHRQISRSAGG